MRLGSLKTSTTAWHPLLYQALLAGLVCLRVQLWQGCAGTAKMPRLPAIRIATARCRGVFFDSHHITLHASQRLFVFVFFFSCVFFFSRCLLVLVEIHWPHETPLTCARRHERFSVRMKYARQKAYEHKMALQILANAATNRITRRIQRIHLVILTDSAYTAENHCCLRSHPSITDTTGRSRPKKGAGFLQPQSVKCRQKKCREAHTRY